MQPGGRTNIVLLWQVIYVTHMHGHWGSCTTAVCWRGSSTAAREVESSSMAAREVDATGDTHGLLDAATPTETQLSC